MGYKPWSASSIVTITSLIPGRTNPYWNVERNVLMHIAVFFAGYQPFHETKDPGLIPLALQQLDCRVTLITLRKPELASYTAPFPILQVARDELQFQWVRLRPDAVIFYHLIGWPFHEQIAILNQHGIPCIIKADTDGMLIPRSSSIKPLLIRELLIKHSLKSSLLTLTKFVAPSLSRLPTNVQKTAAVIVESTEARRNFIKSLGPSVFNEYKKIHVIPLMVNPLFTQGSIEPIRHRTIVAVGRWEDQAQKHPRGLLHTLRSVLTEFPGYHARIIGSGQTILHNMVHTWPQSLTSRIKILGPLPPTAIRTQLRDSRIFLSASRWESFGLAAAEALCMGNSFVGPPLAPFKDFAGPNGEWGTLARNVTIPALQNALITEMHHWEDETRNAMAIGNHWRARVSINVVGKAVLELAQKLVDQQ